MDKERKLKKRIDEIEKREEREKKYKEDTAMKVFLKKQKAKTIEELNKIKE